MKFIKNISNKISNQIKSKKEELILEGKNSTENKFPIFKDYIESFDFFKDNVKIHKNSDNNYYFDYYSTLVLEGLSKDRLIHPFAIDRFHPNKINNKDFWIKSREYFPFASMSSLMCDSIEVLNSSRNKHNRDLKLSSIIDECVNDSRNSDISWYNNGEFILEEKKEINFFEIGFGYGHMFFELKDKCNYYGIDYLIPENLKNYKNFIEIDKNGIPEQFINTEMMDIIFCLSTFQHMSQKDRFDYLEQGYGVLKKGGKFLFTFILMTPDNKHDSNLWGMMDENNRGYVNFFNQLTEVDFAEEFVEKVNNIGYKMKILGKYLNYFSIVLEK